MRIAIVINTSWNIYNFRLGLVRSFIERGDEVIAIAPKDDFSELLIQEGCTFIPLEMDTKGSNPIKDLFLVYRLYKTYKKAKPDVILQYTIKPNIYGSIAARLLKIPTICNVSGLGTVFLKDNLLSKISQSLYKFAFRFPAKVFFQNDDDKKLFLERRLVREDLTETIPGSGINLEKFPKAPPAHNQPFVFLLISRIISDKGIYEFVDAIKILKEKGLKARFQLLGAKDPEHKRGISLEEIDAWAQNETLEYLGTTSNVQPYIAKADCVVLPSYREGMPRTLLEAGSTGRPIIATDVPGCNHIVDDGINGFLCKVKNAEDLAAKMSKMMALDKAALEVMAENSRLKVENTFSEKIIINKYQEAINNILNLRNKTI